MPEQIVAPEPPVVDGELGVDELRRRLHDGVLQLLEFMSVGGWGSLTCLDEYRALARRAATDLRDTVAATSPCRSVRCALDNIVERGQLFDPELQFVIDLDDACAALDSRSVAPLVLAACEATMNSVQHAGAQTVLLRGRMIGGCVVLEVIDDGVGFATGSRAGFGIRHSIVERLEAAGGCVRIVCGGRRGTRVRLELEPRATNEQRRTVETA